MAASVPPPAVMDPSQLRNDELEHELSLRCVDTQRSRGHRDLVALCMRSGHVAISEDVLSRLVPGVEYDLLRPKVIELEASLHNARVNPAATDDGPRVMTLFVHVALRIKRILFRAFGNTCDELLKLARRVESARLVLAELCPQYSFPMLVLPPEVKLEESFQNLNISKHSKGSRNSHKSSSPSSSDDDGSSHSSRRSRRRNRLHHPRGNPLEKWSLRFGKGEDLAKFLEEVESTADMHEIPDADILRGFSSLLTGDAKIWFNASRLNIDSFAQLKDEMRAAFAPGDCDESVLEKISALKQRSDETYVVFEARMQQLFQRLSEPLSESVKVKKVMNGLYSYYRKSVRSVDIKSLRDLRLACGRLEPDKAHILRLEKDEEKKKDERRGPRVSAVVVEEAPPAAEVPEVAAVSKPFAKSSKPQPQATVGPCFRCGQMGHLSFGCSEKIFCIVCGAQGTIAERCQDCQRARTQQHQGNAAGAGQGGNPVPTVLPHLFSFPPPGYPHHQNANRRF